MGAWEDGFEVEASMQSLNCISGGIRNILKKNIIPIFKISKFHLPNVSLQSYYTAVDGSSRVLFWKLLFTVMHALLYSITECCPPMAGMFLL